MGFDAVLGNPPFRGGTLVKGTLGAAFRDYLVNWIARGVKGRADLVAYFFLRAWTLVRGDGTIGLLATNTLAQGETREVGLRQIIAQRGTIFRAVPSEPWPGSTALEIAKTWIKKGRWLGRHSLSGSDVPGITESLSSPGRVLGTAHRLAANESKSFLGSYVLGMGFVLASDEARALIEADPNNRTTVLPYLIGEDLTTRPDLSPSRWVINFFDWPLDRSAKGTWASALDDERREWQKAGHVPSDYPGPVAADHSLCLTVIEERVRPERQRRKQDGRYQLRRPLPERYWQYADKRPALYRTILGLDRVLVTPRVSANHSFAFAPAGIVYADRLVVLAFDLDSHFGLLTSTIHDIWAHRPGSTTHETRTTYFPEYAFETFPFPSSLTGLGVVASEYYQYRQQLQLDSGLGLTEVYNRFHAPDERAAPIVRLRDLHRRIDDSVITAYGWRDLHLDHGFHETNQGLRFTVSPAARLEILDRLLDLNHRRYAEEVAQGLHQKRAPKGKTRETRPKGKRGDSSSSPLLEGV